MVRDDADWRKSRRSRRSQGRIFGNRRDHFRAFNHRRQTSSTREIPARSLNAAQPNATLPMPSDAEPSSDALQYLNSTTMDLFAFPVEIRLNIYSQLLVHPAPINLEKREYPLPARLWLGGSIDLWPVILRTSKQVYDEAVSLLYSNNYFHFPEEDKATTGYPTGTTLAFFLGQIGLRARLLRHICITLPKRSTILGTQLHEDYLTDLDHVRDACVNITTLKLSLPFTSGFPIPTSLLDLIDTRLKALPLLHNVIVNVRWYGGESVEVSDDEARDLGGVDGWSHPEGCLAAKLRERGWMVEITKVPPVKEVWTDPDGRLEFDNEDDYNDYMDNVWSRLEWEREQEEESEYYHQRQLAGYDMGYADDGGPAWYATSPPLPT